jgi:hypothetical protein
VDRSRWLTIRSLVPSPPRSIWKRPLLSGQVPFRKIGMGRLGTVQLQPLLTDI